VDEGISEPDQEFEALLKGNPNRFIYIEPVASYIGWKIMADFSEQCDIVEARMELERSLGQSTPFRRFKNVLHEYRDLRKQWFAFERQAMLEITRKWLEHEGIVAQLTLSKAVTEGE